MMHAYASHPSLLRPPVLDAVDSTRAAELDVPQPVPSEAPTLPTNRNNIPLEPFGFGDPEDLETLNYPAKRHDASHARDHRGFGRTPAAWTPPWRDTTPSIIAAADAIASALNDDDLRETSPSRVMVSLN